MDVIKIIKDAILSQIAFPVLAEVTSSSSSSSGYCINGEALTPGSLEKTGELFEKIPLSPIWADADGRGIFAPPLSGQIVVISFIGGNKAFPFVSGVYGETYKPASSAKDNKLVICDGKGCAIEFGGEELMKIMNNTTSLKKILDAILDLIKGLKFIGTGNQGAPVNSNPAPDVPTKADDIKNNMVAKLFEE